MTIHVFPTYESLSVYAADLVVAKALAAVARTRRFVMALSGGGTPELLYRLLAGEPYAATMPWSLTHLVWGDERVVPPDDVGSNYGQVKRALLDHVGVPPENVHRIRGELSANDAALDYERQLAAMADEGRTWPRLDLALMGMGSDGHTASLFPGQTHPEERSRPALPVTADYEGRPAARVTLTPAVFNDAHLLLFLVTGASKAKTVARVLTATKAEADRLPAARLRPVDGQTVWLLDARAAAELRLANLVYDDHG